jgi:hypothetical protein
MLQISYCTQQPKHNENSTKTAVIRQHRKKTIRQPVSCRYPPTQKYASGRQASVYALLPKQKKKKNRKLES